MNKQRKGRLTSDQQSETLVLASMRVTYQFVYQLSAIRNPRVSSIKVIYQSVSIAVVMQSPLAPSTVAHIYNRNGGLGIKHQVVYLLTLYSLE